MGQGGGLPLWRLSSTGSAGSKTLRGPCVGCPLPLWRLSSTLVAAVLYPCGGCPLPLWRLSSTLGGCPQRGVQDLRGPCTALVAAVLYGECRI
jgi:hypothetical protein